MKKESELYLLMAILTEILRCRDQTWRSIGEISEIWKSLAALLENFRGSGNPPSSIDSSDALRLQTFTDSRPESCNLQ